MERIKRTNIVMVHLNQWAMFALYNSYAINVNRRNQNCYNCRGFRYLARNYRNRENKIEKSRRLKYGNNI